MTPVETRRKQLESRLADLDGKMKEITAELDTPANPDWDDQATEHEGDQVLEAMGLNAVQEVRMIEAALTRIEEDEYGFCVKCGNQISEERLDVLPHTPFCRDCAV